jgi:hypothetical protein
MNALHIVMMVLASWRLVEIITIDEISKKFRAKHKHYFWMCGRCVSVWTSTFTFMLWYFDAPFLNWPLGISMIAITANQFNAAIINRLNVYVRRAA